MLTSRGIRGLGHGIAATLRLGRIAPSGDIGVLASGFASLDTAGSRSAFLHTVRSVIDTQGQRVSAVDRLHLAAVLPTLIVWGEQDSIIPADHGYAAHEAMPGSRFELFEGAGHMPHHQDPERFAAVLADFCASTKSASLTADHWRPSRGG
jgi:pimeloyl-ACP methyl ester carboxylesterase